MKRLIVCCDGTWNQPERLDGEPSVITNVVKVSRAISPDAGGIPQMVLYLPGVGTGIGDRLVGGGTGAGITNVIRRAYEFLALNFVHGQDEIYLFGFSRGAYTVRSLSGFIDRVGIMLKNRMDLFPEAFNEYRKPLEQQDWSRIGHGRLEGAAKRRPYEEHDLPLLFVGVWDTVGALGVPIPGLSRFAKPLVSFHQTGLASCVKYGYQALATHELRPHFKPDIWTERPKSWQTVEQAWFSGAHSDVGGGGNEGLSGYSLEWMVRKATGAGLVFDPNYVNIACRPRLDQPVSVSHEGIYRLTTATVRQIGSTPTECRHQSIDLRSSGPFALYPYRRHRRLRERLVEADRCVSSLSLCP